MSNSAIPDLISEDIFRFGPGDRYALPIGTAAPDALALSQMAEKCRTRHERLLVICADPLDAVRLGQEIPWFSPELGVRSLPDWETLPYDVLSPQEDIVSERLETLYRMTSGTKGLDVVIASAVTAAQRMAPVAYVGANTFFFRPGDTLSVEGLRSNLAAAGYAGVKQVLAAGEFAVRGSIIDVFPMGSDRPFRLDLFDDEIESIRWFDVETQRSMEAVNEIRLLPGHEFPVTPEAVTGFRQRWRTRFAGDPGKSLVYRDIGNGVLPPGIEYYLPLFFEQTATLADYLSAGTRVVLVGDVQTALAGFMKETLSRQRMLETDADRPAMKPEELWLTPEAFFTSLSKFARFTFRREGAPEAALALKGVAVDRKSQNPVSNLIAFTTTEKTRGRRTLIVATSVGRMGTMGELFRASGLEFTEYENWADFLAGDAPVGLAAAPLFAGSLLENPGTAILTETELYAASPRRSRLRRNRQSTNIEMIVRDVSELKIGDAVVHLEHGIGRYQGLVHMDTPDGEAELLRIDYKNEAKLFVPIANLHLISRYSGADPENAPLHALGRGDWEKARRKAAEQVRDTAAELLHLYALRETRKGVVFPIDISDYEAFCEGFAFDETPDQAAAIGAVLNDMTTGKTMDRLVCGDVGFGKTEVALRAAFVAVSAGRQVAVPDDPARRAACPDLPRPIRALARARRRALPLQNGQRDDEGARRHRRRHGRHRDRHAQASYRQGVLQAPRPRHHRRGTPLRRSPEGDAQEAARRGRRPHAHGHADPAHALDEPRRHPRLLRHRDSPRAPSGGQDLCARRGAGPHPRGRHPRTQARRPGLLPAQRGGDDREPSRAARHADSRSTHRRRARTDERARA